MLIPSLIQASVLYLPGALAADGFLPANLETKPVWKRIAIRTALGLALGLVLNAWGAFILGSLGMWNGANSLLFPWVPALLLWAVARGPRGRSWRELIMGWGIACAVFVLVHWIPTRSEWMLGGWDPGIYTNEALQLVRTGSLVGDVHSFAQALGEEALAPAIRSLDTHAELFPGVPIEIRSGTVTPAFPRMSVAFFAGVGRWGGIDGVLKAPLVFAVLFLLLGVAWMALSKGGGAQAVAILVLTVGQPLFIHYANTPSSEMIELLVLTVCWGVLWIGEGSRRGWILVAILGMTLAANRTSFILFGSLGWVGLALWDWIRTDRRQVLIGHGALGVALWVGHFLLGLVSPVAIYQLAHVLPRIYGASLILMGGALLLDGLASIPAIREWGVRVAKRGGRWILPAFWVFLLAVTIGGLGQGLEISHNFRVWVAFTGVLVVGAAIGGSVGPTLRRSYAGGVLLLFLGGALVIVLWQKHAADLYPWALKRFLPWGVPGVALGASFFCVDWARRLEREWLVWVLALILVVPAGRVTMQAWEGREYVGVNQALQSIHERVGDKAWVICDHFQWATPLWFAFGIPALDGHRLLEQSETHPAALFWHRVAGLQRQGRTIYLLSAQEGVADPWGATPGRHRLIWQSDSFQLREIHQHASNRDFPVRTLAHEFKLYEWHP